MATRRIGQVDRVVATDGELVMRVRNGDQAALAAIYDRYVARLVDLARAIVGPSGAEDVVHDAFVGAAGRIDQLRDPDKLKPWLYRITRRYALAHLRGRRVEPMGLEVNVGDATVDGPLTEAERDELRRLVDDAAAGLEERDRVMLHLLYRHELSPEEAGEVLDMRAEQVHARSFRVRDRFARSLGAVVVARHGRGKCGELRELLTGWDGSITPRWRKKISRHLDRCETCSSTKDRVAAPMALLSVAPLVPIAASMRNDTLDAMSNALGFGTFDGGDLDLDGDSSSEQSQQGPHHPSQSQASHPASQSTASTSSTTASSTASAGSVAPSASSSSSAAGLSSSTSSSAAAGSANAGASSASSMSSTSASSLTPTGPTTGWPSGTLAAGGGSSSASSTAAAATAKASSGAAVPPTPEIVSSAPPPPELSEPGIASTLIDTVKAAVGVGVGGAIAVTSTTTPPVEEALVEDPPGLVIEIDGNTIELSPADPVEVTVPIGVTATTEAPAPTAAPTTEAPTTTTLPEPTTTVPETTVPTTTVPDPTTTTPETTIPDETTTTTVPDTTTTVPDTTTTVDPLGGPTGAGDGETGGSEDDGETGGSDDGSTGGADDGSTGGGDDGSTGGADDGSTGGDDSDTTEP